MSLGPVYGLEVTPGGHLTAGSEALPFPFRITMAALDPTEQPQADENGATPSVSRATLRIIRPVMDDEEDEDDDDELSEDEELRALLEGDDSSDDDDEANGGPSDLAKAKKQKAQAAIRKLLESAQDDEDDEDDEDEDEDEMMIDAKPRAKGKPKAQAKAAAAGHKGKGKGKAEEDDEDCDDEDCDDCDDDGDDVDLEQFVLCTLDTERTYQQPLDITIKANERVFFTVSGTHTIYLTGNYLLDDDEDDSEDDSDDEDYDEEDIDLAANSLGDDSDESDDLDDLDDPRVTELDSDDDEAEAPKLVSGKGAKGNKKRPAEDEAEDLDDLMMKESEAAAEAEPKLSKKQQKKLKNNQGQAVASEQKPQVAKDATAAKQDGKKVQFAKQLEQGPTGDAAAAAKAGAKAGAKPDAKPTPSVTERSGVTIDDRTIGKGRTAKAGNKVSVRYIGRLSNGKEFDANKKGKPFTFTLGKGEVIKGWDVGVEGMALGGERRLTVPARMAYGSKKVGDIPANSTLTFDVKLLEIK